MVNYPVGDFLIRIKNASLAKRKEVAVSKTKEILAVAEVLRKIGFLEDIKKEKEGLVVSLTYRKKEPQLLGLKLISKPGLRIYMSAREIEKIKKPSIFLISTPKGVISSKDAKKMRVGGEVIAEVW